MGESLIVRKGGDQTIQGGIMYIGGGSGTSAKYVCFNLDDIDSLQYGTYHIELLWKSGDNSWALNAFLYKFINSKGTLAIGILQDTETGVICVYSSDGFSNHSVKASKISYLSNPSWGSKVFRFDTVLSPTVDAYSVKVSKIKEV